MKKYAKYLLTGLMLAYGIQAIDLYAIPANPAPMVKLLPDGSTLTVRLCGDETFHYYMSEDGLPLLQDEQGFFYYAHSNGADLVHTYVKANDVEKRSANETAFVRTLDKEQIREKLSAQWTIKRRNNPFVRASGGETTYPTKGTQRALAILVEFPNINGRGVTFTIENPRQTFDDMLNKKGFSEHGATGSVHDYYYDSSNGQFDLQFDVFGPVMLENDISFYGNDDLDAWQMVVEACEQLDSEIDFAEYDRDNDGVIDNVYIFYAGEGEGTGGAAYTVWQHAGYIEELSGQKYMFDGVQLNHYACSNEIRRVVNADTNRREDMLEGIGTVCHEFTHVLGFPDLYNTQDQGASFTPGAWSVMDVGSYNNNSHTPPTFSAYERYCMGWLELTELTEPENVVLDKVSKSVGYRINTVEPNEFFVLENRQQDGWDQYIPGHGMLIWHISYEEKRWEYNQVNTVNGYHCIDIEEADDIESTETRAGDAFPGTAGITSFTDDTRPGMLTLNGSKKTNMPITDIEERNGFIYFKVKGGVPTISAVSALPATDVTPISFVANWSANADAIHYKLDVYTIGDMGNEYVKGYQGLTVNDTHCLVTGLTPETTYYYRVRAADATSESVSSSSIEVTTGVATFEYIAPMAAAATDVTARSFTAHWEALDGASSYLIDVFKKEKGEADTIRVDFTDKKLPEGWRTNAKTYLGMAAYCGESAPSISLSEDYNYVESPVLDSNVRGVRFWYRERNNPSGDNRIELSGYVDGQWLTLDVIELGASAQKASTAEWSDKQVDSKIPANCKAIRITYRLIGTGALALDDIVLAYNDRLYPVTLPGWEQKTVGNETSISVTGLVPSTTYYYTVRGVSGTKVTIPSEEVAVTTRSESGIDSPSTSSVKVYVADGVLVVTTDDSVPCMVELYDMQGRVVAKREMVQSTSLVLPVEGIYLVRVGATTHKVFYND